MKMYIGFLGFGLVLIFLSTITQHLITIMVGEGDTYPLLFYIYIPSMYFFLTTLLFGIVYVLDKLIDLQKIFDKWC